MGSPIGSNQQHHQHHNTTPTTNNGNGMNQPTEQQQQQQQQHPPRRYRKFASGYGGGGGGGGGVGNGSGSGGELTTPSSQQLSSAGGPTRTTACLLAIIAVLVIIILALLPMTGTSGGAAATLVEVAAGNQQLDRRPQQQQQAPPAPGCTCPTQQQQQQNSPSAGAPAPAGGEAPPLPPPAVVAGPNPNAAVTGGVIGGDLAASTMYKGIPPSLADKLRRQHRRVIVGRNGKAVAIMDTESSELARLGNHRKQQQQGGAQHQQSSSSSNTIPSTAITADSAATNAAMLAAAAAAGKLREAAEVVQKEYLVAHKKRVAEQRDVLRKMFAKNDTSLPAKVAKEVAAAGKNTGDSSSGSTNTNSPYSDTAISTVAQQRDDALYFDGTPGFMREDWSVTRVSDAVFPHPLSGQNYNNDPNALAFVLSVKGTDYDELQPHVFGRGWYDTWWKTLGLSKAPAKLKGPSRPQSFDGRPTAVTVVDEAGAVLSGGLPPPEGMPARRLVVAKAHDNHKEGHPVVQPDKGEPNNAFFQEVTKLATAFQIYDANPRSESVIPAYTTACVGPIDCQYIGHHIDKMYEFGVGYFVWFVNGPDEGAKKNCKWWSETFPGRFICMTNPNRISASGGWNRWIRMLMSGPNPIPWFINANGDFFIHTNPLEQFLKFAQARMRSNPDHTLIKFQHYSFYIYTYRAYMVLGSFDETVFPAYGEDVEMVYRAKSLDLTFDDFGAHDGHAQFHHVGSASTRDSGVGGMLGRWARDHYVKQKWNINMYSKHWEHVDFKPLHKYPWGMPSIPHRSSYSVDKSHQACILTGRGQMYPNTQQCFWHGDVITRLMPPNSSLPEAFLVVKKWNV